MRKTMLMGRAPVLGPCATLGRRYLVGPIEVDALELTRMECEAFRIALRRKFGREVGRSGFIIVRGDDAHGGPHFEVRYYWECQAGRPEDDYAMKLEDALETYDEVGLWPPVTYDAAGELERILPWTCLWPKATNPQAWPGEGTPPEGTHPDVLVQLEYQRDGATDLRLSP